MNRSCFLLWAALFCMGNLHAQGVAVNNNATPANASAMLDVSSTEKGILIPRLTTIERDAVNSPATALLIFNADLLQFQVNTGTAVSPVWKTIVSLSEPDVSKSFWLTSGNKGQADTSFIGNADKKSLLFKTNNVLRLYIDSSNNKIGIGTNTPRTGLDIATTDALIVPVGTTAQRPVVPVVGMIRFNATTNKLEGYTSTGWVALH